MEDDFFDLCTAQFELVPTGRRDRTHTCMMPAGHAGPHVCPECQQLWVDDPPGPRVVAF